MQTLPIVLALFACLRPEQDIDRTRVIGEVRVDPWTFEEKAENVNDKASTPIALEPLRYGWHIHTGVLTSFGTDEEGNPAEDADTDCWSLQSPVNRGIDESSPPVDVDVTLKDATASARITLYNRDETSGPQSLPTEVTHLDVVGWNLLTLPLTAKVQYSLCISGLEGPENTAYELVVGGQHPDGANILIGVYQRDDPTDRGALLGGTNALAFRSVDRWSWIAPYEMLFLREFETDTDGEVVTLDENVKEGYVYAGNWSNLSQKLPAGTWYSSRPLRVDLTSPGEPEPWGQEPEDTGAAKDTDEIDYWEPPRTPEYPTVKVEDPVVIDAIAPIVVGVELAESEPNDMPAMDPTTEADLAQDLGVLSGPGFVDIVSGGLEFKGNNGSWDNDVDAFRFQVPAPTELAFTLDWAGGADLDLILLDAAGEVVDYGYYGQPEVNTYGTGVLEPGQDYFALVLMFSSPDPAGTEVPWTLSLEQIAP